MKLWTLLAAVAVVVMAVTVAEAGTVTQVSIKDGKSLAGLGAFEGTIQYDTNNGVTGLLDIALKNLSSVANDGKITGFLFNINGNATAVYQPTGGSDAFSNATGLGLMGSPFGNFEFGAAIGGNFLGGGNPNPGIDPDDSRTFRFNVTGADVASLEAKNFFSELSTGTGAGEGYERFVVRFRGFEDDGSDTVAAVPMPGALYMGLTLMGLMGVRRRRAA